MVQFPSKGFTRCSEGLASILTGSACTLGAVVNTIHELPHVVYYNKPASCPRLC
jgi:hypothetical protein